MWNHQGRIAYRRRNPTSLRPTFERLETRSVLNGASLQMPSNSMHGGFKPDNYGKPDSYWADGYGNEENTGPLLQTVKDLREQVPIKSRCRQTPSSCL